MSFNGSDQYLSVADNADLNFQVIHLLLSFMRIKPKVVKISSVDHLTDGGADTSMSYSVQTGGGSPSNSLRAHVGDGPL